MSDGYNTLLGYILWIVREDGSEQKIHAMVARDAEGKKIPSLKLPISGKEYKVTERNVKLYLSELKEQDPSIIYVDIDRLSRMGRMRWEDKDDNQNT